MKKTKKILKTLKILWYGGDEYDIGFPKEGKTEVSHFHFDKKGKVKCVNCGVIHFDFDLK